MRNFQSAELSLSDQSNHESPQDAAIREYLKRELPPAKRRDALQVANAALAAGLRYDRYAAARKSWQNFAARKRRLEKSAEHAIQLAITLSSLDLLSWDDLSTRFAPQQLETLLGSLLRFGNEAADLARQIQNRGRPRDLAEERWILELANIYEIAFGTRPRIWGSGSDKTKHRGKFYDFLLISRPRSFPQHGKLTPRQVHRVLEERSAFGHLSKAV